MKHLVTFEVDGDALFDFVRKLNGDCEPVGTRLAHVLLAPNHIGWDTALGLGCYGIVVKSVERAPCGEQPEAEDPKGLSPKGADAVTTQSAGAPPASLTKES